MRYSIEKITTLIGAHRMGSEEYEISWLLTDSRSLCFPEETLFFAIRTKRDDGHNYIEELYKRGVRNFVVEDILTNDNYKEANFLKVTNTLAALQRLAERHRDEFDIPIIGLTGSNGKTMVKEWLYQVLSPDMVVTRSPRSYNSQIGVPLSVWLLDDHTQVGIFEAGISEPNEMDTLRNIIQPKIGILTSIGAAHQENFKSIEEKCEEKLKLFKGVELLIYNADEPIVKSCVDSKITDTEKIAWSRTDRQASMFIEKQITNEESTTVNYVYRGQKGEYTIPFIDDASVECSIAVATTALYLGVSHTELIKRMQYLEPVAMRLEVKEGQHGCTIINDSYNSDITSLDIALDFMSRRTENRGRKQTLILSDIFQSGETPSSLYSRVSELSLRRGIGKFIGIGPELCASSDCIRIEDKHFFLSVERLIESEVFRGLKDEVILIKGSRSFGFDHIAELLEQRVHETVLEVNLNSIVSNLNHYKSFLNPTTKIVCMVKADAYGSGAIEVSKTLQEHRVDYLAVAVADEGAVLRRNGITANIMVMNPETTAFKTIFDYDLEPEIYSFRIMEAMIGAAEKEGITNYPIHLKIDTGMHRLGFDPINDIDELIVRLKKQDAILPRSIFSHFVGSDSDAFDSFSEKQYELLKKASSKLQLAFNHKILTHMDNSAGIVRFPERQMDMVRLGIGLYGVDSRDNSMLSTVSSLRTIILQLRQVPKEETVGYSRKGILKRDSVIAVIPIGYADGLSRHLGRGKCYCLVNGEKAPYVGNICMDIAMVDVTDIPCKEGDNVEIFGEHLPVTVLSDALNTIPYEILTGVSGRVKRIYTQE